MNKYKITHSLIGDKFIKANSETGAYAELPNRLTQEELTKLEDYGVGYADLGFEANCEVVQEIEITIENEINKVYDNLQTIFNLKTGDFTPEQLEVEQRFKECLHDYVKKNL